ncbi:MAG: tRNA guanosine(34) transglycosylase Tgt [Patescibacteria group bacterium]|nr:tRNA guanosine(34) transglycosylase Tgt [Patescibacteria group bacterium]
MSNFRVIKYSKKNKSRRGILKTKHGSIKTPFFMPIATKGAVKTLTPKQLKDIKAQIVLGNTYHLNLRPGAKIIKKAGGLHHFMNWPGPILTDSGGYQVFSLAKFRKITPKGVIFKDNVSGQKHLLTPEKAIQIQIDLGVDIIMSLDECPPYPCPKKYAHDSMKITTDWAKRGLKYFKKHKKPGQQLFGIIQGSVFKDLREEHAKELSKMDFDGLALGGLAVGEKAKIMYKVIEWIEPHLPKNKPRYLMGVGYPEQIAKAVEQGIDMFDCVLPTRNARHGVLYTWKKEKYAASKNFYQELKIKQSKFKNDLKPVDSSCQCYGCKNYSKAYLRHLFMSGEFLGQTLATLHNLRFYLKLMEKIRNNI